jgi:RNA polymerase sigma factor (sigma-70 family)
MASIGFPATRDSLIQAIAASDPDRRRQAYDALIAAYRQPVYRYLVVVRQLEHDDADDLTQDFFAHALAKETLERYRPEQARFRTFLRVCLDHFAANAAKSRLRRKRGGGLRRVPLDLEGTETAIAGGAPLASADPEEFFRREWIRALFERGLAALESSYRAAGKVIQLEVFLAADVEPADERRASYQELATRFGVPVTQITNYLFAARRAFRRAVLLELRAGSATDREFRDEARDLFGVDPP